MIGILYSEPSSSAHLALFEGPASLCPAAGRYRMLDFSLSNLANAGIGTVGVLADLREQPELSAYLGVGQEWDLDRRRGGLAWLPGLKGALTPLMSFLAGQSDPYVLAADAAKAWTVPCRELFYAHLESGCDMTAVQTENEPFPGLMLLSRSLLLALLDRCAARKDMDVKACLKAALQTEGFRVNRISFSGPCLSAQSLEAYYRSHLSLLQPDVLASLFPVQYPVLTRQQDDAPAYLEPQAKVENSLLSGGCTIGGTVRHSVLFRNIRIGAGAVADHCVLLPGCAVESGAVLHYVLAGEGCRFSGSTHLEGSLERPIILEKGGQR